MLQKIIDFLYRHPKSELRKFKRFGGYLNYKKNHPPEPLDGTKLKRTASGTVRNGRLNDYFLTGKKYLYQTLFCISSLRKVTQSALRFVLVDDGSFDDQLIAQIKNQLPGATIVTRQMIEENLNHVLPERKYPDLHRKRQVYPHIKKLTDIHTISPTGWKLVLDSDMLFWNEPLAILNWLKKPIHPLYMVDCQESYGYSKKLMEKLCGNKIPSLLNVGVIGLDSAQINWEKVEQWLGILEEKESTSYYLEQALTAMLLAGIEADILPAGDYIVNPDHLTVSHSKGILHHYVDLSKESYFKIAWKKLI